MPDILHFAPIVIFRDINDSNTRNRMKNYFPTVSRKLWLSAFATATVLAVAYTVQVYVSSLLAKTDFRWQEQLLIQISNWYFWVAFFPVIVFLAEKYGFDSGSRLKSILVHVLAGLLIAATNVVIYIPFSEWLLHSERGWIEVKKTFAQSFVYLTLWRFLIYQVILAVCIALNNYRRILETQVQSSRLQDNILRSQIESLKMQIDPDFLFKNLDHLPKLMHDNLDQADEMVARLGDYLRITLENSGNSEITLREEVELLKCYLEIENIRLNDQVEIQFDLDEECLDCSVPSLILQSPVEDAIRQKEKNEPLHLVIIGSKTDTSVILTIVNPEESISSSESLRLQQLLERLNALYRNSIEVHMVSEKMRIEVPLTLEKRDTDELIVDSQPDAVRQLDLNSSERISPLRKWLIISGIFTFLAIYFAFMTFIREVSAGRPFDFAAQLLNATGWYIWALLTPPVLLLSAKYPIQEKHRWKHLMIHVAGYVCTLAVASVAYAAVRAASSLGENDFNEMFALNFAKTPFAFDIVCYFTIVAVESAIRYQRRMEAGKVRTSKLNTQLSRARLQALKMQLHPHFLFNALNSLSGLMQESRIAAEEMIQNLKNFLRLTINSNHVHEIPFEKELEFLDCYLAIERVRFQSRLRVNIDIEVEAMKVPVPNLVLQPIVENAIRHGIAPRKTTGEINISARRNNGTLTVSIRDNGPGLSKSRNPNGLGLSNTRERLTQLYGTAHRFEMVNAPEGGLMVTLEIPVYS
jgi:LytS/YehU family sensor histidine kinase